MLQPAVIVPCPGMSDPREHFMRDGCYSCAPYWEKIPTCPVHNTKLKQLTTDPRYDAQGKRIGAEKGYCRTCKKHYDTGGS